MSPIHAKPRGCAACPAKGNGYIPQAEGPDNAEVLILGGPPSQQEGEEGKPFIGKAGAWFSSLLRRHGIDRETLLLDHVVRCTPFASVVNPLAISHCVTQPHHASASMRRKGIKVVVALGAEATRFALGLDAHAPLLPHLGYPAWSFEFGKWVIPNYHPFFLFRGNQNLSGVFAQYVKKGVDLAAGRFALGEFPPTLSDPSLAQVEKWVEDYEHQLSIGADPWLAFDIETPYKASEDEGDLIMDDPTFTILRTGFAYQGSSGLSLAQRSDYLPAIKRLLASPGVKLVWNGRYDVPRLTANQMPISGPIWDGMLAWHVINSDLPKGLGFVAPLLTNLPRWKHLGGENPGKYNAIDAVATVRICERIVPDLKVKGQWDTFQRHIVQIDHVLDGINQVGILFDGERRKEVSLALNNELDTLRQEIDTVVPLAAKSLHPKGGFKKTPKVLDGLVSLPGVEVVKYCAYCMERSPKKAHFAKCGRPATWNTRKQGKWAAVPPKYVTEEETTTRYARPLPFVPSNTQMIAYLAVRGQKGVGKRDKQSGKSRLTFDEKALRKLMVSYPADPLYPLVLKYRKAEKQLGYVGTFDEVEGKWDGGMPVGADGRVHTTIGHNPSTLRFSSIAPNLQNQPRDGMIRSLFVADPGFTLWEADYSAIEAKLVGYEANSEEYVRLAELGVHDYLNAQILRQQGVITDNVDLSQSDSDLKLLFKDLKKRFNAMREVAKRVVHGCVPGDHEVLTPGGWQRFDTLDDATPVAQWEKDGRITFVLPSLVTRLPYTGPLHTLAGRAIDIAMTPTHRVVYETNHAWHVTTAETLPKYGRIPTSGVLAGGTQEWSAHAALTIAIQADGSIDKRGNVRFRLRRPRKVARLTALCIAAGIPLEAHAAGVWTIKAAHTAALLAPLEAGKTFSWAWLQAFTVPARWALLQEVLEWDGTRGASGRHAYLSTNRANAERIQTLAHLSGQQALLRLARKARNEKCKDVWVVSFNRRTKARIEHAEREMVHHAGMVYCVTVPSGFFLLRHHERISITGNSNYGMQSREMYRLYPEVFGTAKNADALQKLYFEVCPMIPRWQEATVVRAEEEAELRNPFGYLHRFWNVCEYSQAPDGEWLRKWGLDAKRALAFGPQSTAAGVIKEAMLSLEEELNVTSRRLLLLQVHDSLLFRIPLDEMNTLPHQITKIMERPIRQLPLPWDATRCLAIGTEAKMGPRWGKEMIGWQRA